jgi:hypothetical protein
VNAPDRKVRRQQCLAAMPHLLIVGRDLSQLVDLSIALRGFAHVATLAATDEVASRALWSASKGLGPSIIVCMDKRDAPSDLDPLLNFSPPVLFLIAEAATELAKELEGVGCLFLSAREGKAIVWATLVAYAASQGRA